MSEHEYYGNLALYVVGMLEALKEEDLLEVEEIQLTPRGVCEWDQLVASGFIPMKSDVVSFLTALFGPENALRTTDLWEAYQLSKSKVEP